MVFREQTKRPDPWEQHKERVWHPSLLGFHALEWLLQWAAYFLSHWAFLEVLDYLGRLSVLVVVLVYFSESDSRRKQRHYQAWQVINTAQGKGGNGGRIEALQELNKDGVDLVGVDLSGAFLQGLQVRRANLLRSDLGAADLRHAKLSSSQLGYSNLKSANFRDADLNNADLTNTDCDDTDLVGATLRGADLTGTTLKNADLRNADIQGIRWQQIRDIENANILGVRNPPVGFVSWALQHKATLTEREDQ